MKCKYCGGNLSLEVKYCPYCGKLNEEAQQHVEDMEKYQKEFADTKEEVYEATKKYTGVTVRLIALIILALVGVVFFGASRNVYSIKRSIETRRAISNYSEYTQKMDQYLEKGQFLDFYNYVSDHCLNYNEKYNSYRMVMKTATDYQYCFGYISEMTSKRDDRAEYYFSELGRGLGGLYESADPEEYNYYGKEAVSEEKVAYVEEMITEIHALLKTYVGLTDEEIEGLKDMSDGSRAYLIEQAYVRMKENGIQ